uniref:Putative secreted peptide n=1 Tax=Anopheles braziliensis TaxID=58242 RepID=A0A2M3ZVC5_9DIPT
MRFLGSGVTLFVTSIVWQHCKQNVQPNNVGPIPNIGRVLMQELIAQSPGRLGSTHPKWINSAMGRLGGESESRFMLLILKV